MIQIGGGNWKFLTIFSKIFIRLIQHTATLFFVFIQNQNKIKGAFSPPLGRETAPLVILPKEKVLNHLIGL